MGQGYDSDYGSGGSLGATVDLTTEVTGTLPVANGGTGAASLTDNRLLTGTGTSAITAEANLLFTGTLLTALDTVTAVVGHTAAVATSATNTLQVLGTAAADSSMTLGQWSAAATGPQIHFIKSRNATIGSSTIVQDNDVLGGLSWQADDGTDFVNVAADFFVEVSDASPAANDVGTAFVWRCQPGGGGALTERMRLDQDGVLYMSAAYFFATSTILEFGAQGGTRAIVSVSAFSPGSNDAQALGSTASGWSDLHLASGGTLNWSNGNVVVTQSTGLLTLTTGALVLATSASPASNATGVAGQIAWDASYIYVCTATNTWERAALTGGY